MVILKSILILCILASCVDSVVIFASFLEILSEKEMVFSTRYKYSDLLIANSTKATIFSNQQIKQVSEIPQIGVRYAGATISKVYELNNDLYVYATAQGIEIHQIDQYLGRNMEDNTRHIFLISVKYDQAIIPSKYKDSVCFYDEAKRERQQIKQTLRRCIKQNHQKSPRNYDPKQQTTINPADYYIPLISLAMCFSFTGSKLFLLRQQSSLSSGV